MIEEFLLNYCPWLQRVRLMLRWFYEIIIDQVNPGLSVYLYPTHLWPSWDWGTVNALMSHAKRPWVWADYGFYDNDDDDDF